MSKTQDAIFVSMRVIDMPKSVVGSMQAPCSGCSLLVWVDPVCYEQARKERGDMKVLCSICAGESVKKEMAAGRAVEVDADFAMFALIRAMKEIFRSMSGPDICPRCAVPVRIEDFRDEISRKEYHISGMCQACQDKIYNKEDGDENGDSPQT